MILSLSLSSGSLNKSKPRLTKKMKMPCSKCMRSPRLPSIIEFDIASSHSVTGVPNCSDSMLLLQNGKNAEQATYVSFSTRKQRKLDW